MRSKKLLVAIVLVVAVAAGAFTAAQASASGAPVVIPYAKTCDLTVGHCMAPPVTAARSRCRSRASAPSATRPS